MKECFEKSYFSKKQNITAEDKSEQNYIIAKNWMIF